MPYITVRSIERAARGGKTMQQTARKWYQGQIDKNVHAVMKAAVAMDHNNIEEFINEAITEKLKRDGYFALKGNERRIAAVK